MAASGPAELLVAIARSRRASANPYALVSGIVREIAVDQWLSVWERMGLVELIGDHCKITPLGRKVAAVLDATDGAD